MTFPLNSFFNHASEAKDFYRKLHDPSKHVIVFEGTGGNGKSTLLSQILTMAPVDHYTVVQEPAEIPSDSSSEKIIYITTNFDANKIPPFLSYDVVRFPRTFGHVPVVLRRA